MERSFRDRLAAIEARNAKLAGQPRNDITQDYGMRSAQTTPMPAESGDGFGAIFTVLIALVLGAGSVLAGRLIEFHFLAEADGFDASIRFGPDFLIALALSFFAERILRCNMMGQAAITSGFVAMMWFEIELAKRFPEIWSQLYDPQSIAYWIAANR